MQSLSHGNASIFQVFRDMVQQEGITRYDELTMKIVCLIHITKRSINSHHFLLNFNVIVK